METRQYPRWWARHTRKAHQAAVLRGWVQAMMLVAFTLFVLFVMWGGQP